MDDDGHIGTFGNGIAAEIIRNYSEQREPQKKTK